MFFIVMAIICAYALLGAITGNTIHQIGKRPCQYGSHDSECGHFWNGLIGGVFWPVALPICAGIAISGALASPERETRTEKRRREELEEAQHQAEMARQQRIADAELDRQLAEIERKAKNESSSAR